MIHKNFDLEIKRCPSLDGDAFEKSSSNGQPAKKNDIFVVNRIRPYPIPSRIKTTNVNCLAFLNFINELAGLNQKEIEIKINIFLSHAVKTDAAFFIFPNVKADKISIHVIGDRVLKENAELHLSQYPTLKYAIDKNEPFFAEQIPDEIWKLINDALDIALCSFLCMPVQLSSGIEHFQYFLVCFVNKRCYLSEKERVFLSTSRNFGQPELALCEFSKKDLELVKDLLHFIAPLTLINITCLDRERRLTFHSVLREVSNFADALDDIGAYMQKVVVFFRDLTQSQRGLVVWPHDRSDHLQGNIYESAILDNKKKEIWHGIKVPSSHGTLGKILATGSVLNIQQVETCEFYCSAINDLTNFKTKNLLGSPIRFQNEIFGVFELHNSAKGYDKLDEEIIRLIVAVCNVGLKMKRQLM